MFSFQDSFSTPQKYYTDIIQFLQWFVKHKEISAEEFSPAVSFVKIKLHKAVVKSCDFLNACVARVTRTASIVKC